jgi:arylsulfatase A-like enzyme
MKYHALALLLCSGALAAALTPAGAAAAEPPRRPNILWLVAEDMGPEALSCSGTPQVWTPNLDRLAAEGVRYTRAYTTAPVCSPSRSALMTGMYAVTIGAHNHRSHRDDGYTLPDGVRVLTDWLRDAGYFTANLVQLPSDWGFRGTGKTDWNFRYQGKPFDSTNWDDLKSHQPFYAQINFHETHRKYNGPAKADPAKVVIPPYYPDHPVTRADWAAYLDAASELDRKVGLILKQLEADGLAQSTIVMFFGDNGQSHVRGKQFCYEEGLHVPLILRWPKGFPAPKHFQPGAVDERLIEAIDFAPTMLAIAGVKKPEKMEGRIFLGEQADAPRQYAFGARDRCDETVMRIRTVRDARYRYIRNFTPEKPFLSPNAYKERSYPVWNLLKELHAQGKLTATQDFLCRPTMPPEELYDLAADPHEIDNLAASEKPEHQAALRRLRGVLEKWIEKTNDQGRVFEPADVARAQGATNTAAKPDAPAKPKGKKKKREEPASSGNTAN